MSAPSTRRPGAALVVAALCLTGLAAPASASPWSDTLARLSGWFASTPLGALWGEDETQPEGLWQNDGGTVPPVGKPATVLSDEGIGVDPNGVPKP